MLSQFVGYREDQFGSGRRGREGRGPFDAGDSVIIEDLTAGTFDYLDAMHCAVLSYDE